MPVLFARSPAVCGIVLFLAVIQAEEPPPAPPVPSDTTSFLLRYKFEPGQMVAYDTVQDVEFTSRYTEASEIAKNRTSTTKCYKVTKVHPDGSAELDLVIRRVVMEVGFNESELETVFDSSSPELRSEKYDHVAKTIGVSQGLFHFAPSGKLIKLLHLDPSTPMPDPKTSQTKDVDGESHRTFLLLLPEKEVRAGDSWVDHYELRVALEGSLQQKIKMKRTYTLVRVENGIATISLSTQILSPIDNVNIEIQLIQRELAGTIRFDLEKGLILERNIAIDKTVIGPSGSKFSMRAKSDYTERLVDQTPLEATLNTEVPQ